LQLESKKCYGEIPILELVETMTQDHVDFLIWVLDMPQDYPMVVLISIMMSIIA
jgi:hypothetical protein